jgi:hypothetical protein
MALRVARMEGGVCNLGIDFADARQGSGICDSTAFSQFPKRSIMSGNLP